MTELVQPILSRDPEPTHLPEHVLPLATLLELLKEEENYFGSNEYDPKQMISRLRKIFYDKAGWNTQVIRKAAHIQCRYMESIVECDQLNNTGMRVKQIKRYIENKKILLCRKMTYRSDDRIYGDTRKGQVPFIYDHDHQDVILPENWHCDLGHVLAGLDALNNPQPVSPLPDFLFFLHRYFPYAESNADVATWLGDIASIAVDFLFCYRRNNNKPLDPATEQYYINMNATAPDMLGNIDAYVIHKIYNNGAYNQKKITDVLHYYYVTGNGQRKNRFEEFCRFTGLGELDANVFSNEDQWMRKYVQQLRNAIAFLTFSVSKDPLLQRIGLTLKVWNRKYEDVIKVEMLLRLFLTGLKKVMGNNNADSNKY